MIVNRHKTIICESSRSAKIIIINISFKILCLLHCPLMTHSVSGILSELPLQYTALYLFFQGLCVHVCACGGENGAQDLLYGTVCTLASFSVLPNITYSTKACFFSKVKHTQKCDWMFQLTGLIVCQR